MFLLLVLEFVAFPDRKDALFRKADEQNLKINVDASGSLGLFYKGKCNKTYPNQTLIIDEKLEWCSNIAPSKESKPWISYNIEGRGMKITGYSIRNGCCWYACCCEDNSGQILDYRCCCRLYSFSLQGSNDNKTWETLHSVVEDKTIWGCKSMTYELPKESKSYTFIRLVQDEEYPNCPFCMQINQIELYGSFGYSSYVQNIEQADDDEETISIIGKVRKE